MRPSTGQHLLRLSGGVCGVVGFLAWIAVAWKAFSGLDGVTAENEEGARLLGWALAGTLLMILGTVLMHVAADEAEQALEEEGPSED